jgi:hypothetical protein
MDVDEFLEHHGVKGMHWGVRKERSTASRSDRKAAAANVYSEIGKVYMNRNALGSKLMNAPAKSFDKNDLRIKAGAEFYRVSSIKDEPVSLAKYVSTNKQDRDNYNAIGGTSNFTPGLKRYQARYESVYKSTTDLKSPSEQKRFDAVMEIVAKPSITLNNGQTVTGRQYLESLGVGRTLTDLDNYQYGRAVLPTTLAAIGNKNLKIGDAYFNSFRDKGYNAIIDDNDRTVTSKAPLILLNPDGTIKRVQVRQLTNNDITQAQKNFRAPDAA